MTAVVAEPTRPARRPAPAGLTEAEATARLAAAPPPAPDRSSRSYASIVRAIALVTFLVDAAGWFHDGFLP